MQRNISFQELLKHQMAPFRDLNLTLLCMAIFCGSFSPLHGIRGGREARFGDNPWQALLSMTNSSCGGSLIHERYVLTAAHCLFRYVPTEIIVRLGEHNWREDVDPWPHHDYAVEEVIMHPLYLRLSADEYGKPISNHDIALIRLRERVKFEWYIKAISLPPRNARFVGRVAKASGWGLTQIDHARNLWAVPSTLRELDMSIIKDPCEMKDCDETLRTIVFATAAKGNGLVKGDSGGPLSVTEKTGAVLVGVLQGSNSNYDNSGQPANCTKVTAYLDWVEQNLNP